MGKRKNKKKAFRNSAGAKETPEFILEAVEPTPEFKARTPLEKVKTDQGAYTLRVRDKRPIDKYHRLYCIDSDRGIGEQYRRGITEDQFRAADRLACNYERTFHNLSKPLDGVRVHTSKLCVFLAVGFMNFATKNMFSFLSKGGQYENRNSFHRQNYSLRPQSAKQ